MRSVVRLLLPVAMATTSGVLPGFLIASQAVQLSRDLGLTTFDVGASVAAAWLVGSLLSSRLGRTSEELGGNLGLRAAALLSMLAMLWLAVAARSLPTVMVGAAIGGAANSLAQPSANLLVARSLPVNRHGVAFGVKQGAIPVATMLGGLAVPVITIGYGWRATFCVGALFALVAALSVPSAADDPAHAQVERLGAALRRRGSRRAQRSGGTRSGAAAFELSGARRRALVVLSLGIGMGAAAAGAMAAFIVTGAVEVGMAEGTAGLVLTAGSLAGVVVRLVLGARADRVVGDQLVTVSLLMAIGALSIAMFAVGTEVSYLLATPLAFGAGWAWPGLFNLSLVRRYPEAPGAATGATQTGTYMGAAVGPMAFGALVDNLGWEAAWMAAAVTMTCAAVAVAVGRRLADEASAEVPAT